MISMGVQWEFNGNSMRFQWEFNGNSIGFQTFSEAGAGGISIGFQFSIFYVHPCRDAKFCVLTNIGSKDFNPFTNPK
mgnify:CR=1 FL=1